MKRPEIDALLDQFRDACRDQGIEQCKAAGFCDILRLSNLIEHAARLRNRIHAQIDQIAEDAVQSGVER